MKKLDKFIFKSFIGPFVAILLVAIFILLLQFLWVYIDELAGKGLGFKVIAEFMFWAACTTLPLAMPLATLLASVMTLGQMGENSELTAMKASGISLTRVMAPILVTSLGICVAAFYTCNDLVPYATNKIFTLRDDFFKKKEDIKIPVGTFYDGIEGYILRIDDREKDSDMMKGVMVYDHSNNKGNTSLTVADSGLIRISKSKDYLTFILYNGCSYQETNTKKFRDTTLALQRINFSKQEMIIPLENYAFQKSEGTRFGDQAKSMNLKRLSRGRDSLRVVDDSLYRQHLEAFARSVSLNMRSQLDSSWKGKPVLKAENFLEWETQEDKKSAYETAASNAKQMQNMLQNYSMDNYDTIWQLRRIDLELLKKFAQALACLAMFLIGAPLGALIRKGGLGTSAIVSILFFVLYWVVDITGNKLAKDGATSAFIGAFISAMVLIPIGIFLTWKAIHDASLFGNDSFKSWWRRIRTNMVALVRKPRIVFMGTPDFAVAPLDALVESRKYKIRAVVTVPDKPAGRGLKLLESPVKQYAVAHGIPVLQPEKLKDPEFIAALTSLKADLFVVVGFRMLPEQVWQLPRKGTFNLHTSLLPQYRGAAPVNWALINGETITGVTTFLIDSKIDTGGIILRQEYRIGPSDTAGDVHEALKVLGSELVLQTAQALIEGNVETRVQRSFVQGSEVVKAAPKLTRELCHIDWNDTARNICNLVRGLSPAPTAYTCLLKDGSQPVQLKVFSAEAIGNDSHAEPGTLISDGKSFLAIAAADGAVSIKDLQMSGKKRMDVKAFLLGFRNPESYTTTQGTSKAEIAKAAPYED